MDKQYIAGGTSLVVQALKLRTPNARSLGLIPGLGMRSYMLQLTVVGATKDPHAISKIKDPISQN